MLVELSELSFELSELLLDVYWTFVGHLLDVFELHWTSIGRLLDFQSAELPELGQTFSVRIKVKTE